VTAFVRKIPGHRSSHSRHSARAITRREHAQRAREHALDLRERALRALAEVDAARKERERLLLQMREANERLVLATLRADELVERAVAASVQSAETASLEAARRKHAELVAADLQASNRAKDEFLAMLGHELRSPLAPILLALDMIAMNDADPHKREHSIIERQVSQLARLVDDLLDVSRIRSGKIQLRREPVELAEVVSRAVETAIPLIEAKSHALTVEVPRDGFCVDGDVLRLTQVVGNLLTNAAKYTPRGGTIAVTGERCGTSAVLRVRDSGIGISHQMLPTIFDLFSQEQQPAGAAPGGLGLGLSIVRSLVKLHGGTVTANSAGLGRGSEFVVELPMNER
jgi:signal transduction histidine kinase